MRYTGPQWRINRKEGATVLGTSEKWKKRMSLPGQFPTLSKRPSDYAIQFREKQKVKRTYGMTEAQFRRFYKLASRSQGNTSTRLLQLLELRADNVLFRLGFAATRTQARQYISHGHVLLNGKKHDVPSSILKPGDELIVKENLFAKPHYQEILEQNKVMAAPKWVEKLEKGGKVVIEPTREQMDQTIKERLIVELYSR